MFIERLVTVHEPEFEKLPTDLAEVLSEQERRAISERRAFFDALANRAEVPWLREVCSRCAASEAWHLEFYGTNANPLIPYFRFNWGGAPAVCLSRGINSQMRLPPLLHHFYTILGGFQENQFCYAGGICRLEKIRSVENSGYWVNDTNAVNPSEAMIFLTELDGGCLCFLPDGSGVWLREGEFKKVDLALAVSRYFEALLEGRRS
jgi:hypothetical protein